MATLTLNNVQVIYDNATEAVRDVSLAVESGRITTLLGSNGAGKSTLLKAISGILYPEKGVIANGTVHYDGMPLNALGADVIVQRGLMHVPEGRGLFATLSVEDNLIMGAHTRARSAIKGDLHQVYTLFPRIAERRKTEAADGRDRPCAHGSA
jgi:branched-chain amino acid transport system ATP-binding protein